METLYAIKEVRSDRYGRLPFCDVFTSEATAKKTLNSMPNRYDWEVTPIHVPFYGKYLAYVYTYEGIDAVCDPEDSTYCKYCDIIRYSGTLYPTIDMAKNDKEWKRAIELAELDSNNYIVSDMEIRTANADADVDYAPFDYIENKSITRIVRIRVNRT